MPWSPNGKQLPPTHLADTMAHVRRGQVHDYNQSVVACRSWLVPEWNAFKIRFKRAVEDAWNNQIILLPNDWSRIQACSSGCSWPSGVVHPGSGG